MVPRKMDPPVRPVLTLGRGGGGSRGPRVHRGGGGRGRACAAGAAGRGQTLSLGRVPGEEGRACWGEQGPGGQGCPDWEARVHTKGPGLDSVGVPWHLGVGEEGPLVLVTHRRVTPSLQPAAGRRGVQEALGRCVRFRVNVYLRQVMVMFH